MGLLAANEYADDEWRFKAPQILVMKARGSSCFDAAHYRAHNPDLQALPPGTLPLWKHFVYLSQFEARPHRSGRAHALAVREGRQWGLPAGRGDERHLLLQCMIAPGACSPGGFPRLQEARWYWLACACTPASHACSPPPASPLVAQVYVRL